MYETCSKNQNNINDYFNSILILTYAVHWPAKQLTEVKKGIHPVDQYNSCQPLQKNKRLIFFVNEKILNFLYKFTGIIMAKKFM